MKDCYLRLRPSINRLIISIVVLGDLIGCATMQAQMSIEPYTKNKVARAGLEQIAEEYCHKKRTGIGFKKPEKQPDFIFTTDGCSRWPNGSWLSCCIVHDISYWCGGSSQDRKGADQDLKQCVNNKVGFLGALMYSGVRVGGTPWLPTPWRWGYGWEDWPMGYEKPGAFPSVRNLIKGLDIQERVEKQLMNKSY